MKQLYVFETNSGIGAEDSAYHHHEQHIRAASCRSRLESLFVFLPLDEAIASRTVFVGVSRSDT